MLSLLLTFPSGVANDCPRNEEVMFLMNLAKLPITIADADKNFEKWKKKFETCSAPTSLCIHNAEILPTTHTFPSEKHWIRRDKTGKQVLDNSGDPVYESVLPYHRIFFESRAIVSDGKRAASGDHLIAEPRRKMPRVRELGLNWFVFCSHGIHNPRFAGEPEHHIRPFGVFVSKKAEDRDFPYAHASRRDIDEKNAEVSVSKTEDALEFIMTPQKARYLLPMEIASDARFNNDFFAYWGDQELWLDDGKRACHWQWKYEFRFYASVPMDEIEAVLWPNELEFDEVLDCAVPWAQEELSEFVRDYPKIAIITYPMDYEDPGGCFWSASYKVASFYCAKERFPISWLEVIEYAGV